MTSISIFDTATKTSDPHSQAMTGTREPITLKGCFNMELIRVKKNETFKTSFWNVVFDVISKKPTYPSNKTQFYCIDLIIGVILYIVLGVLTLIGTPYDRVFVERDPTLSYPWMYVTFQTKKNFFDSNFCFALKHCARGPQLASFCVIFGTYFKMLISLLISLFATFRQVIGMKKKNFRACRWFCWS